MSLAWGRKRGRDARGHDDAKDFSVIYFALILHVNASCANFASVALLPEQATLSGDFSCVQAIWMVAKLVIVHCIICHSQERPCASI